MPASHGQNVAVTVLYLQDAVEFHNTDGGHMRFVLSGGAVQIRSFPLPSGFGKYETVKARFWPLLRLSANQEPERSAQAPPPPLSVRAPARRRNLSSGTIQV